MRVVWPTSAGLPWGATSVALVGGRPVVRTLGEVLHSPLATPLMSDLGGAADRGSRLSLLAVSAS